jgi:outer membrane protein TolC
LIRSNILDATTRKQRRAIADAGFRQAQLSAVNDTLALANQTRQAWIASVAAFEAVGYLKRAKATSDAGSELARRLGETGALNKAGQAREQAFNAELAGQLAKARLNATKSKEELTRLMGLWGTEVDYYVPDALPVLPRSVGRVANIEAKALRNRVDLRVAKLGLEAQAAAFGLTDQTRIVSDLEIVGGAEFEREVGEDGDTEKVLTPQIELEFAIPIYDTGKARMRKAELMYLQAANVLAETAVNVRSEARGAEASYHASYKIARHYRDVLALAPDRRGRRSAVLQRHDHQHIRAFDGCAREAGRLARGSERKTRLLHGSGRSDRCHLWRRRRRWRCWWDGRNSCCRWRRTSLKWPDLKGNLIC